MKGLNKHPEVIGILNELFDDEVKFKYSQLNEDNGMYSAECPEELYIKILTEKIPEGLWLTFKRVGGKIRLSDKSISRIINSIRHEKPLQPSQINPLHYNTFVKAFFYLHFEPKEANSLKFALRFLNGDIYLTTLVKEFHLPKNTHTLIGEGGDPQHIVKINGLKLNEILKFWRCTFPKIKHSPDFRAGMVKFYLYGTFNLHHTPGEFVPDVLEVLPPFDSYKFGIDFRIDPIRRFLQTTIRNSHIFVKSVDPEAYNVLYTLNVKLHNFIGYHLTTYKKMDPFIVRHLLTFVEI